MSVDIKGLKSSASQLATQRRSTADSFYHDGMVALKHFTSVDNAPNYFKKSFDCFTKALQRDRFNPDTYNALSYMWILLGDHTTSLKYLRAQDNFCQSKSQARPLISYLESRSPGLFPGLKESEPVSIPPSDSPSHAVVETLKKDALDRPVPNKFQTAELTMDYEVLYERVERKIYENLKFMMRLHVPPLTMDSDELKKIKIYQDKYLVLHDELGDRINFLEAEIDVSGLRLNLNKLALFLQRLEQCLTHSKLARRTRRDMLSLNKEVSALLRELKTNGLSVPVAEDKLEAFFDRCDSFADVIDQMENLKLDTQTLEGVYNKLVAGLETLQDRLDDICAP